MTSVLNVDSIAAKDGTSPVELTKQSAAKAFSQFDGTNLVLDKSLNISSLTDHTDGNQTLTFANSFDGVHYAVGASGSICDGVDTDQTLTVSPDRQIFPTSSSIRLSCTYISGGSHAKHDGEHISAIMHGDLA